MKLIMVLSFLLLLSCGNKKQDENFDEDVVETITKVTTDTPDTMETKTYEELTVLDFEALEKDYLNPPSEDIAYVINFWATWCKPCIKELPYFEELRSNYKDKDVKVVLVSLDFPDNIEKQVIPFIRKHNLQSEIVLLDDTDANTWIPKVNKEWSGAIPATIFLKGKNEKFFEKSFTYNELEAELKTIL